MFINNWQVGPSPDNPFLMRLVADNALFQMTPDQARSIAAALIKVADAMIAEYDDGGMAEERRRHP